MKIVRGTVTPVRIPLIKPFTIALGTLTHSNHVLVKLEDDEGGAGWGEGTTFPEVYGYDQWELAHVLKKYLVPSIMGMDPADIEALHTRMDEVLPHNLMAKCAVDIAAHDMVSRKMNEPVYSMLGGKKTDRIPVVFTLGIASPDEAAERAVEYVSKAVSYTHLTLPTN